MGGTKTLLLPQLKDSELMFGYHVRGAKSTLNVMKKMHFWMIVAKN
jgi:hypothetical protein